MKVIINFLMLKGLLSKIAKKYRRKRETFDEDNIPLMELAKRMREQEFAEAYSPSDQKPINEVNVQKQANDSNVKNLLQAIIGIL